MGDLSSLSHVEGASTVPASQDTHPYLVNDEAKVRCEDLEEDRGDNWDTNDQVPSDVEFLELTLEEL